MLTLGRIIADIVENLKNPRVDEDKPGVAVKDFSQMKCIGRVYSNHDCRLDDYVVQRLEDGQCWAKHFAWNFCAAIWFDTETQQWNSQVMRYQAVVARLTSAAGAGINSVIDTANEIYGED